MMRDWVSFIRIVFLCWVLPVVTAGLLIRGNEMNEVLPALTSEDNHFVNDILSLVSVGSYITRTTIQDPKGAQLMEYAVMEKVDPQLKTGVSSKAVLDQLREAMEEAGANFELPPEPKPTQALLEAFRDSLQWKKS